MVIETGAADGRQIAAWPSLKTDLRNAGAEWMDQEVCVDGNLVTSRKPDDIPAFNREMLNLFALSAEEIEQTEEEEVDQTDEADEEAPVALFVRMEAKPGREADVENLLRTGLSLVEEEPDTTSWFGMRLGGSTFGIFDTFPDDSGRQAHLATATAVERAGTRSRFWWENEATSGRTGCTPPCAYLHRCSRGGTQSRDKHYRAGTVGPGDEI